MTDGRTSRRTDDVEQDTVRNAGPCYGNNMEKPNREKLMSGKMTSHMKLAGKRFGLQSTFPNVRHHLWPQASKILVKKEEPKIGYGTIYNTTLTNTNIEIHTERVWTNSKYTVRHVQAIKRIAQRHEPYFTTPTPSTR